MGRKMECDDILRRFLSYLGERSGCVVDDTALSESILILPFQDRMGDKIVVRLHTGSPTEILLDDDGFIANRFFLDGDRLPRYARDQVRGVLRHFRARENRECGTVELVSTQADLDKDMAIFTRMLVALDIMLDQWVRNSFATKSADVARHSLGPRAASKIRSPLKPLIRENRVQYKKEVDGRSVPTWVVDFAYKPSDPNKGLSLVIAVDLAVAAPLQKSALACIRAQDIKAAHANYDIQVAYDTHGWNSDAQYAADVLKNHAQQYTPFDITNPQSCHELVRRIQEEIKAGPLYMD